MFRPKFTYEETKNGRLGKISTIHGDIITPCFIFCATKAAIKGHDHSKMLEKTQIILSNTFHLFPFADTIEKLGGIHKFINWSKPILTDSGGFQVFSLGHGHIADEIKGIRRREKNLVKIRENGCTFTNPKNGDKIFIGPEESIATQIKLGVDFVVAFDECTPSNSGYDYTARATDRSHRWEKISLDYFNEHSKDHQGIYGIVQGGIYENLRDISIKFIKENNFFGVAIGGSLGKTKEEMYEVVKRTSEKLRETRPVHLLGIGRIEDIVNLYSYVDTFDCVEPTRIARHGTVLIPGGKINLLKTIYVEDSRPIDKNCACDTCKNYSRAYIHYLFRNSELLGISLAVQHNVEVMNNLMEDIRKVLKGENNDENLRNKWLKQI